MSLNAPLKCVACLWTMPLTEANSDEVRLAITIMNGYAVCQKHMSFFTDERFSLILRRINRRISGALNRGMFK